ncbi:hypothetical protein FQA39_LY05474 [Lamprigera yunnana]|nr:hypothetical protein FQA39_LY05474 [Lamprigera yunnana]
MITTTEVAPLMAISTAGSPTSVCSSSIDAVEDHLLPSSLAAEELQLALNKEAGEVELETAIVRCKDLVLECDQCSPERKWIVRHLIELRLRLQECKEALLDPQHPRNLSSGVSTRTVLGHHLVLQPLLTNSSRYCDHCTGSIWSVVQAWYKCQDCGYSCHHKCMASIVRECAHVTISERGSYEIDICPEIGLSAQKYQCAECRAPLPIDSNWSEARRCDYTGLYYCSACHWGSSAVIPARIVHNWDFLPQLVCQASLQLLKITAHRPLISLEKLNPQIFTLVHELSLVKRLRGELNGMRKYLLVCRSAIEDHLIWKNIDKPHIIESPNLYSLQDLVDIQTGELLTKLHLWLHTFSEHIKILCEICKGRGHICEVCSNKQVLFPFEENASICTECSVVLHKNCALRKKNCPKCLRLEQRKLSVEDNANNVI